jgi:hypothetical protein
MMNETVFVRNSASQLREYQRRIYDIRETITYAHAVLAQAQAALHDAEVLAAEIVCRIDR